MGTTLGFLSWLLVCSAVGPTPFSSSIHRTWLCPWSLLPRNLPAFSQTSTAAGSHRRAAPRLLALDVTDSVEAFVGDPLERSSPPAGVASPATQVNGDLPLLFYFWLVFFAGCFDFLLFSVNPLHFSAAGNVSDAFLLNLFV